MGPGAARHNANAVDGALTTFYTDIQTGVSEGSSLALGALPAKLYEVAPYVTRVDLGVVFSGGLAINVGDSWDGLPEEVQAALLFRRRLLFEGSMPRT